MSRLIDILTAEGWDFDDATLEAILRYEDRPLSVITRKHPDGSYRASIYLSEAVLTQDGEFLIAFTNFPGETPVEALQLLRCWMTVDPDIWEDYRLCVLDAVDTALGAHGATHHGCPDACLLRDCPLTSWDVINHFGIPVHVDMAECERLGRYVQTPLDGQ